MTIEYQFDFSKIRSSLRTDRVEVPTIQPQNWLHRSYAEPESFWSSLFEEFQSIHGARKSSIFEHYVFSWDLLHPHQGKGLPALRLYDAINGWQEYSFDYLTTQASQVASEWLDKGFEVGSVVCVVLHPGLNFLIAMLTTLKLGGIFSFIPPQGRTFVKNRLRTLEPAFVVTENKYEVFLGDFADKQLPSGVLPKIEFGSIHHEVHGYEAEQVVMRLFSPLSTNSTEPVELKASDLYHRLLSDAFLLFGLQEGDKLSAPGFHDLQYQPWLFLVSLFSGATFVLTDPDHLIENAECSDGFEVTVVGLNHRTRDWLLSRPPTESAPIRLWFKDVAMPMDWESWERFSKFFNNEIRWAMNILANSAYGGIILFGQKLKSVSHLRIFPSPGNPWSLMDFGGGAESQMDSSGFFGTPALDFNEHHYGLSILNRPNHRENYFVGTMFGVRGARTYPKTEVQNLVCRFEAVYDCVVLNAQNAKGYQQGSINLLIFLDAGIFGALSNENKNSFRSEIYQVLSMELGSEFIPGQIELYSLYPEKQDGKIDLSWCEEQYRSGYLQIKQQSTVFPVLSELRMLMEKVVESDAEELGT